MHTDPTRRGPVPKYKIDDLEVGDERELSGDPLSIRVTICQRARRSGKKFTTKGTPAGVLVRRTA